MVRGWVALTGTPGTGKSTVADWLRRHGVANVNVGRFAQDFDLTEGFDEQRMSAIVDPARVAPALEDFTQRGALLLLDGHWSHEVPGVEAAIVLRLRPRDLEERLRRRGWPPTKVRENLEAEAVDLILQEAVAALGTRRVCEVDTTGRTAEAVGAELLTLLRGPAALRTRYRPGRVDWSDDVLAWF